MTAEILLDLEGRPVVAHRGAAAHSPENTLPAFELAASVGTDAFELDVRVSADGVPVVCHDPTLDRTTDRTGAVASLPVSSIQAADAGARFSLDGGATRPFMGRGVRIPRLEEVLERFPEMPLLVELKTVDAAGPVQQVLLRHGAVARAVIASFSHAAIRPFLAPPWLAGASRRGIAELAIRSRLGLQPRARGYRLFAVPHRYKGRITVPTRAFVGAARRLGAPVHVWTVDDPATARHLWALGVAGIITNDPATIRAARER